MRKTTIILTVLCACSGTLSLWAAQPPDGSPSALSPNEIVALRRQIAEQKQEITRLEKAIQDQQSTLDRAGAPAPNVDQKSAMVPASSGTGASRRHEEINSWPLSLSIGNTTFTPLGFVDAAFYGRSTNVGSGIGTNFGGIPFSNSTAGHLSEANFSDQNSRIGFRVDSTLSGAQVLGYFEADFLGNQPGSVFVTSNANTFRMRNIFVDVQKGMFEVLGGQDWSLATPNRNGVSPLPSDIFYTQNMDTNYQLGLVWSRQTQARFTFHPTDNFAAAVSLENPQQYIGGSGGLSATAVAFPSALSAALTPQFNNGGTSYSAPNLHPDIIVKAAYDPHVGGKHLHFEAASLTRSFKDALAVGSPAAYRTNTITAESGEVNANLEVARHFHLVANTFFGSGNGRYVFGLAPDVIVRADGRLSPVHTYSTVDGFEAQTSRSTMLYGYYGAVDIGRNIALDTNGKPIGYGFAGSPNGDNRTMQEATIGFIPTLWKTEGYGALSIILQYSYLTRNPWSVATGSPATGHTNMYWVDLRYTLP